MKKIGVVVLCLFIAFSLIPTSSGVAFATTTTYSDVLSDLQVDENFNVDDYPINQTDYSLNLIQLAESNDNFLLVYVYQPSAGKNNVLAKKIRMSVDDGKTYNDYNLTLLNGNSVFFKYKVDNYVTDYSSTVKRTYNVVELLRPADETLGDKVLDDNNNTISMISYTVGWTFTAVYKDGQIYYGKAMLETVTVSDKYCGQLRFNNDPVSDFIAQLEVGLEGSARMLHFIAFNTEVELNDIVGADVSYALHTLSETVSGNIFTAITGKDNHNEYETTETLSKPLLADVSETYKGGLFGHRYTWKQIMTKDDFVNNVVTQSSAFFDSRLTEQGASELEGKKWVLCFASTDIYSMDRAYGFGSWETKNQCSYVSDETVLSFTVNRQGNLYTLGVVDNYQTGDGISDNEEKHGINEEWWKKWFQDLWDDIQKWLLIIGALIGGVILVILLCFVCPPILSFIKAIFRILFAPFRWLFGSHGRVSARRNNKNTYKRL